MAEGLTSLNRDYTDLSTPHYVTLVCYSVRHQPRNDNNNNNLLATKESTTFSRVDDRRPHETSLVLWILGKPVVWDIRVPERSHFVSTSLSPAAAAAVFAANNSIAKCSGPAETHHYSLGAVERGARGVQRLQHSLVTSGRELSRTPMNRSRLIFFSNDYPSHYCIRGNEVACADAVQTTETIFFTGGATVVTLHNLA